MGGIDASTLLAIGGVFTALGTLLGAAGVFYQTRGGLTQAAKKDEFALLRDEVARLHTLYAEEQKETEELRQEIYLLKKSDIERAAELATLKEENQELREDLSARDIERKHMQTQIAQLQASMNPKPKRKPQ